MGFTVLPIAAAYVCPLQAFETSVSGGTVVGAVENTALEETGLTHRSILCTLHSP